MRFIMTFVWAVLLVMMLNYVTGSIANVQTFDVQGGLIAAFFLALIVFAISAVLPNEEMKEF